MPESPDYTIARLHADNVVLRAKLSVVPGAIARVIAAQANDGVTSVQLMPLADLHMTLGGELTELEAALVGSAPPTTAAPATAA
jgi:hypothetical protein